MNPWIAGKYAQLDSLVSNHDMMALAKRLLQIDKQQSLKFLISIIVAHLKSDEKRLLRLFIWAGCGCHKDLNTVRSGYVAMEK